SSASASGAPPARRPCSANRTTSSSSNSPPSPAKRKPTPWRSATRARPPSACCARRCRRSPRRRKRRRPPSPNASAGWRRTRSGCRRHDMSHAHELPTQIDPVSFAMFSRDFAAFTEELGGSFARFGFAVISDHGIPQDRIDAALAAAKKFFALPEADKLKYKLPVGGQRGYTPFGVETAKGETNYDLKEFWHVGRDLPPGHRYRNHMADNVWPDAEVAEFHETVSWLYGALDAMGLKVLEAIACYLGLERQFFVPTVDFGNSILRLLHYPPVPKEGPHIR